MGTVIYEKHYPKWSARDQKKLQKSAHAGNCGEGSERSFSDVLQKLYGENTYLLLPERAPQAKAFVRTARELAEFYEVDVRITEHLERITVEFFFQYGGPMSFLKEIIRYADELTCSSGKEGYDVWVMLECYTHAVFYRGRRLRP